MMLSISLAILAALSSLGDATQILKRANTVSNTKTPPVSVKGNGKSPVSTRVFLTSKAFFANNKRFYIRGIDYQPGGDSKLGDPLSDPDACKRDVEKFKQLGVNTVRIYTIDNSQAHDECMKTLADAGIYVALDVNSPKYSLNRKDSYACWRSYNDVRGSRIQKQILMI
jgi:1,3-beta-glucanosyltransferase GAS5